VCRENNTWNAAIVAAVRVVRDQFAKCKDGNALSLEVQKLIEPTYELLKANSGKHYR
jgi:hypothetical protein